MNYFWGITLLIISVIIVGCSGKGETPERDYPVINNPEWGSLQDQEPAPFRFELVDSIIVQSPDNDLIGGISSIITDNEDNIYFIDFRQSKLVSVSANGEFRWMTGQEGKGPGDFENARSMVSNGKSLLIGNIGGSRLDKFDYNGKFIRSIDLGKEFNWATVHKYLENGLLAVSTSNMGQYGLKTYFLKMEEDSVRIIDRLIIDQSHGIEIPRNFGASAGIQFHNGQIISGSFMDYSLTFYNPDSTITKVITRDFTKNMKPGLYQSSSLRSIRMFGGLESPLFTTKGYMIVPVQWPDNVPDSNTYMERDAAGTAPEVIYKNFLDIYNADGELLYSIKGDGYFPKIGRIQHMDSNDIFYTAKSEPEPVIYRYKLIGPEQL